MKMKRPHVIVALLLLRQICLAGEWFDSSFVDPFTDAATYTLWTSGSELPNGSNLHPPKLAVRIESTGGGERNCRPDVFVWFPSIRSHEPIERLPVTVRYDKEPPVECTWRGSDNDRAFFCDAPQATLDKLLTSNRLALRFAIGDKTHTAVFDLDGLSGIFRKVKDGYLEQVGKSSPSETNRQIPAAKKKPCKLCKGKSEIKVWEKCENCKGTGWIDNSFFNGPRGRCPACIRSIRTGMVCKKAPCPKCSSLEQPNLVHPESNTRTRSHSDGTHKWLTSRRIE